MNAKNEKQEAEKTIFTLQESWQKSMNMIMKCHKINMDDSLSAYEKQEALKKIMLGDDYNG